MVLDPKLNEFNAFGFNPFQMGPHIIGVVLGDMSKAYPYKVITEQVVVNDFIGKLPVVVYTSPEDEEISVFVRKIDELVLDFEWIGGKLADRQTGTVWDPITGFGVSGELKGELLKELPYSTAYDWAWKLFYPNSEIYEG